MELGGVVGINGLVGSAPQGGCGVLCCSKVSSEAEPVKQKEDFGSGSFKQGRPNGLEEHDWRCLKMARTEASTLCKSSSHSLLSEEEQMNSFSTAKTKALLLNSGAAFRGFHQASAAEPLPTTSSTSPYVGNAGLESRSLSVNMQGVLARVKWPFTPTQWMELEHQALIYKCIHANHPIPSNLLISIGKSLNSSGFSAFPNGSLRPGTLGWGSFHLGFSGNADPEPGRCRRTDGKKWRCSRDAVADQKYCERHMNRGRHRSRKPVEGHNGHAAKVTPIINPSPSSSACGDESSNSSKMANKLMNNLQPSINSFPTELDRILVSKEKIHDCARDSQELSMLTSVNPKSTETLIPISKQHLTFKESSPKSDFELISSDLPLNLARSSYLESNSFISTFDKNNQDPPPHSLRHFTDDWTPNKSNCSTITWPQREESLSNKNQHSVLIPLAFSDLSSSSSVSLKKLTHSPPKLTQKYDSVHTGLGVGSLLSETQRQAYRAPISWGASAGGPLGEALNNTSNSSMDRNKKCSSLDLMVDDWDLSPQLATSPTGVLQKTCIASLSSSTASSPRTEKHKAHDSISSLRDDLLCSTLVNPTTINSSS